MKTAGVYCRSDKCVVHSTSWTTTGLKIDTLPFVVLSESATDGELGAAIMNALNSSRENVPHPTDWKEFAKPRLEAVGAKNESDFMRGTTCCGIHLEANKICFTPARNLGPTQGFQPQQQFKLEVEMPAEPQIIGAALRRALDRLGAK